MKERVFTTGFARVDDASNVIEYYGELFVGNLGLLIVLKLLNTACFETVSKIVACSRWKRPINIVRLISNAYKDKAWMCNFVVFD